MSRSGIAATRNIDPAAGVHANSLAIFMTLVTPYPPVDPLIAPDWCNSVRRRAEHCVRSIVTGRSAQERGARQDGAMTTSFETGFLAFTAYHEPGGTAKRALEDSIELFKLAERIGLAGGWVRVRHFERALTGVFPFLGAVASQTERIAIGTAVVPIAHEHPVRLAEDSATVDLLSDGRLELGVSTGIVGEGPRAEAFSAAYWHDGSESVHARSARVLTGYLDAIAGRELATTDSEFRLQFTSEGEGLRVYPRSERLAERIWYGSGTEASAIRAARLGLNLQVSTINTERESTLPTPVEQARFFDRYSEALDTTALEQLVPTPRARRVSISRYVIPYTSQDEKDRFLAASDRHVPRWPALNGQGWNVGTVEEVIDQLGRDAAIQRARREFDTTLLLNLPSTLGLEWTQHLLHKIVDEVLPALR